MVLPLQRASSGLLELHVNPVAARRRDRALQPIEYEGVVRSHPLLPGPTSWREQSSSYSDDETREAIQEPKQQ